MTEGIAPNPMKAVHTALAAAIRYVLGRQCPQGGFCFYRTEFVEEPNLADTYDALCTLRMLQVPVLSPDATLQYVREAGLLGVSYIYFQALILEVLGRREQITGEVLDEIRKLHVSGPDPGSGEALSGWLEKTRKIVLLKARFGELADSARIEHLVLDVCRDGGFGNTPNLLDTRLALEILHALGSDGRLSDTMTFVDELQRLPAGFVMTRNSSAHTLEVLAAGVRCCALLRSPVRYASRLLDFVLGCQSSNGGFARAPVALPDLELTRLAVETILQLAPHVSVGC